MPDEHPQLQAALDLAHADPPISACGWNRPPGVCTCPAWDTVTRLANGGLLAERPCPPPDLPTTLSTPDDVAAVCEAAGLAEIKLAGPEGGHRRWRLDEFQVDADHDGFGMGTGQTWFGNLSYETPTAVLTAAIEAARATGGGDRD